MANDRYEPNADMSRDQDRPLGRESANDRGLSNDRGGSQDRAHATGSRGDDDRGFMDKMRDEARSWFADDERGGNQDRNRDRGRDGPHDDRGRPQGRDDGEAYRGIGGGAGTSGGQARNPNHDPHYHDWRERQIAALDRDYEEYRQENRAKFENDFGSWRSTRQGQRDAVRQVREHMEVVGNDGEDVGVVDHVRGDDLLLTRNDEAAGGRHHLVPVAWIQGVGEKVMLNRHGDEARRAWKEADDNRRALNERPGQGSAGPHILDRSFGGTYDR